MSTSKMAAFMHKAKTVLNTYYPEILTGIGITGMLTSTILAVRATPEALRLIEASKQELHQDELTPIETVKATWRSYLPSVIASGMSVACLIGASSENTKRRAALTAAWSITEAALNNYEKKVVEIVGEKKNEIIRDAIADDRIKENPMKTNEVIITAKGDTVCFDAISSRYFKSDIEKLKHVQNEVNKRLVNEMYISLNEFYYEIGLPPIKIGDDLGWNIADGLINFRFSAHLSEDGTPCIAVDYNISPTYKYCR